MPKESIYKDFDDLEKMVAKNFKKALKDTAVQYNMMMEAKYEMAIAVFYASYVPAFYRRTDATFYGSNLYNQEELQRQPIIDGTKYIGGIYLDSYYIEQNFGKHPYRADTGWVYDRTLEGIHGMTEREMSTWGRNDFWQDKGLRKYANMGAIRRATTQIRKKTEMTFDQWWKLKNFYARQNNNQYKRFREQTGMIQLDHAAKRTVSANSKLSIDTGLIGQGINKNSKYMEFSYYENKIFRLTDWGRNSFGQMSANQKPKEVVYRYWKKINQKKEVDKVVAQMLLSNLSR